jgi:hypothetical protein
MTMKRKLIIVLTGINVCLLAWVLYQAVPQANAQAYRGAADYLSTSAKYGKNTEAIYVLDLANRRMAGWRMDVNRKPAPRMTSLRGRNLVRDFGRKGSEK